MKKKLLSNSKNFSFNSSLILTNKLQAFFNTKNAVRIL